MHNAISGHRWSIRLLHAIVWESVAATWEIAAFHTITAITLHSDAWWFRSMLDAPSLQHSEGGHFLRNKKWQNNPQRHEEFTKSNLEPSKKTYQLQSWTWNICQLGWTDGTPPHLPHHQPFPALQAWWDPLVSLVQRSGVSIAVEATPASKEGFGGLGCFLQIGL